jgi:hypothetical protein
VDENISTYKDVHHISVQWNIISEGLDCSTHSKGCHSKGMIIGGEGGHSLSLHHNLFAHNVERNPRVQADGVDDIVNNVIYNPTFTGSWGPSHISSKNGASIKVNYVGNYYKAGPDSGSADYLVSAGGSHEIFFEGNIVPRDLIRSSEKDLVVNKRHEAAPIDTDDAQIAYERVLTDAGANIGIKCDGTVYKRRDPVDERIVSDVREGTGGKIDDPSEVGGWPDIESGTPCSDRDHDGMPDAFENRHGLNPDDPADGPADTDGDGYTNLEAFLNGSSPGGGQIPTPPSAPTGLRFRVK